MLALASNLTLSELEVSLEAVVASVSVASVVVFDSDSGLAFDSTSTGTPTVSEVVGVVSAADAGDGVGVSAVVSVLLEVLEGVDLVVSSDVEGVVVGLELESNRGYRLVVNVITWYRNSYVCLLSCPIRNRSCSVGYSQRVT